MTNNTVFGIYSTPELAEEAVDELVARGFASRGISVLHPTNQSSREFARLKNTTPPAGTAQGPTADLPLDGTWGFMDPGAGPKQGALPEALEEMGVPPEWCHGRVKKGHILVCVQCNHSDEVVRATGVLTLTEAEDIAWSVPAAEYRAAQKRPS